MKLSSNAKSPGGGVAASARPVAGGRRPERQSSASIAGLRPPVPGRARGVALIVTLILLSVITFLAIAFLVLSHQQRGAVSTATDATTARFAADTGQQRAMVEILAQMLAFTNDQLYGLTVSTNFINPAGFDPNPSGPSPDYRTNVNYEFRSTDGQPLDRNQQLQNLANLLWNPRPPVFMSNRLTGRFEHRFYYDINRNGLYDPNGLAPVISPNPALPYYDLSGNLMANIATNNTASNRFVGDPEWIGIPQHPEWPHSSSNQFLARYAYVVVPASKTLDVNYIHNQAASQTLDQLGRNFVRNQGVGTWEINLPAFLHDLNTNLNWGWGGVYDYIPDFGIVNGNAFVDAVSFLRYRYNSPYGVPYNTLSNVANSFPAAGVAAVSTDRIDQYSDGILQYTSALPPENDDQRINRPWLGADNPNHFFSPQDFFDPLKTSGGPFGFTNRLIRAGMQTNSYDRYTFSRLIEQLGTESQPEPGLININYKNVDALGSVVPGMETQFIGWTNATEFFTNAADRMLKATYPNNIITVSRIQVWPTNHYTPSVHRLLQLAANIYDSTTNRPLTLYPQLPSVFRPFFRRDPDGTVYIEKFAEVTVPDGVIAAGDRSRLVDLNNSGPVTVSGVTYRGRDSIPAAGSGTFDPGDNGQNEPLVFGAPLIIGARKGFPNFNEFGMQSLVQITRKLQFRRSVLDGPVTETNQMYIVNVGATVGVEAWNSYTNAFPRPVRMTCQGEASVVFSNISSANPGLMYVTNFLLAGTPTNVPGGAWLGTGWGSAPNAVAAAGSFVIPFSNSAALLRPSTWRPGNTLASQLTGLVGDFERTRTYPVPHWSVTMGARVRYILVDTSVNRIVDYVNLSGVEDTVDLAAKLQAEFGQCTSADSSGNGNQWCTNRLNGAFGDAVPTYGILNQIWSGRTGNAGMNEIVLDSAYSTRGKEYGVDFFRFQFGLSPIFTTGNTFTKSNVFYAPLDPSVSIAIDTRWQANDPLVHYTVGDLVDLSAHDTNTATQVEVPLQNLRRVNTRYEPWRGRLEGGSMSLTRFDVAFKDPLVLRSDDWDFPTNKFPNLGWLGRVHRGTPWQTVYLKARDIQDPIEWVKWSGNNKALVNWDGQGSIIADAALTRPIHDRDILGLFTTAINDNAARGRQSINQEGLASWSAVLSGVLVMTNIAPNPGMSANPLFNVMPIPPAGYYLPGAPTPLARIVEGINRTRADTNLFPLKVFTKLGDILAVPELTVGPQPRYVGTYPNGIWTNASPFLNLGDPVNLDENSGLPFQQAWGINEEEYERIPRQVLSLLTLNHTPRFVIYSYGQTLHPANSSLVSSGPYLNLCTNYQVTAEVATRTVVRVEGSLDPRDFNNPDPLRRYPPRVITEQFNILPPD